MKAYKVFNKDMTCKGFQYEVGKTYTIKEDPIICNIGFHACENLADCFNYYSFDPENRVAEVMILGKIAYDENKSKLCTNKIKIKKLLTWNKADIEDRKKVKKIPGFDNDLFLEISGINVNEELK